MERARALVDRILRDARAHDHKALLMTRNDPVTEMLLGLLPEKATQTARIHLRGAGIWQEQQRKKIKDRFVEVQRALDSFDPALAKGLLQRIDADLLGDADRTTYNNLLLNAEARQLEMERFSDADSAISDEHRNETRRRWWKRR